MKDNDPGDSVTTGAGGGGSSTRQCLKCNGPVAVWIDAHSGDLGVEVDDPVATRGYPLTCNIAFNSQGVETARPMGNATFTYDIHVAQQMIYTSPGVGALHWIVMDGDGSRLDFGLASGNPSGVPGIFSHLTLPNGGGYIL